MVLTVIELLLFENLLQKYILYVLSNILMELMKWNFVGNVSVFLEQVGKVCSQKVLRRDFPKVQRTAAKFKLSLCVKAPPCKDF